MSAIEATLARPVLIGTARTGTVHIAATSLVKGRWIGSDGAACNNRLGARALYLGKRHEVNAEQIAAMRAAGAFLCGRCFGKA